MARLDSFPNLFIVGAAKSGTTSLHNYLCQHPDIFMCTPKEPHFLIANEIGKDRIPISIADENEYLNLFLKGEFKKYRGESSVMYLMYPEIVIPKINEKFGRDCKIIIMLRNPIERAYSGFHHVKRYNQKENISDFSQAWNISEQRYFEDVEITPATRYQKLGLYHNQVKAYLDCMKHVHVIIYDDYKIDLQSEMNKIFDFLNIEKIKIDSNKKYMVGGWQWKHKKIKALMTKQNHIKSALKFLIPFQSLRNLIRKSIQYRTTYKVPEIKQNDRTMLNAFYKHDIQKLSVLLGRDLNHWVK